MFTPQKLEKIPIELQKIFSKLEQDIMIDIVRRVAENGEITRTADYQINRLHELGVSKKIIKKYIQEALALSEKEIDNIYEKAIKASYTEDKFLYKATGTEFIEFNDNDELQQTIRAIKKQTKEQIYNLSNSTGFIKNDNGKRVFTPLTQYYQDVLDKNVSGILNGAIDYNTAIKNTVQEMTKSGLRTIDYVSGKSFRIESAVRTALMTGVNQIAAKISDENAEKLGTEYFEVSAHGTARPSHQVWQGRVYKKEELESVCGLGKVDGLCGANCRHSYYPFIPGISVRKYTDEQLEEWANRENTTKKYGDKEYTSYEASQEQRKLERLMRKQRQDIKLLKEGGANEEDIIIAETKYRIISDEYVRFSKAMELPQQRERVYLCDLKTNGMLKANDLNYDNAKSVIVNRKRINYNNGKEVKESIDDFINKHSNSDVEYARVINKDSWETDIKGTKKAVDPTICDNLKDSIVIHNHPSEETEYTFSPQDVDLFVERELKELYGIDEKYIYKLTRNSEETDSLENLEMNLENAQHFQIIKLARSLRIGYRRYINNGKGL